MTDSFPAPSCSSPHAAQADSATPGVSEVCTSAAARAGPLSASHHSLWIQKSFVSTRYHRQHWHRHTVCLDSRHTNHFTNPRSLRIIHDDNIRLISDYRSLTQFFVCQSQLSHMRREIFENQQEITTRTVIWARQLLLAPSAPKLGGRSLSRLVCPFYLFIYTLGTGLARTLALTQVH